MVVADEDTPYYEECEEDKFYDYSAGPYFGHPNVSGESITYSHYMLYKCQYPDHTFGDPSELLQFVRRDPQDHKFYCTICEKFSHKVKPLARNHVESQHFPNTFNYPCDQCDECFDSKSKFNLHRQRKHKQVKMFPY